MRAKTTGRYVVLNGMKLYELAEYPEFGTQEYLDLPDAEARSRDDRYLGREQVEALKLEVLKEVKMPTGVGAVVQDKCGETYVRVYRDLPNCTNYPWADNSAKTFSSDHIRFTLEHGGKVLSEGVEV